jgi:hypothetical protein
MAGTKRGVPFMLGLCVFAAVAYMADAQASSSVLSGYVNQMRGNKDLRSITQYE